MKYACTCTIYTSYYYVSIDRLRIYTHCEDVGQPGHVGAFDMFYRYACVGSWSRDPDPNSGVHSHHPLHCIATTFYCLSRQFSIPLLSLSLSLHSFVSSYFIHSNVFPNDNSNWVFNRYLLNTSIIPKKIVLKQSLSLIFWQILYIRASFNLM